MRVLLTYGATEYTQNVTQAPRDGDPKYGSPGIRLPYTQVKTVELDGDAIKRECGVDEIGVVVVKGPSVTPGYLEPKYNEGMFTRDGWFNSGDLGRIDADGYLWLTGRAKDVIIRGGHNIDPSVIEETLLKHPRGAAGRRGEQARRLCRRIADRLCAARAGRARPAPTSSAISPSATSRSAPPRRRRSSSSSDAADRRAEARQGRAAP